MQNKWFLSQQSKPKQDKIKIKIFTAMFLMQYFCLHGILPFSKSYPEIESIWTTTKCREKSILTRDITVTCATLCVSFSCFSKTYSEIKSMWPINSSKQEIICATFHESFWSKSKARDGTKSKNKHPSWLCCTVVRLSEAATRGVV